MDRTDCKRHVKKQSHRRSGGRGRCNDQRTWNTRCSKQGAGNASIRNRWCEKCWNACQQSVRSRTMFDTMAAQTPQRTRSILHSVSSLLLRGQPSRTARTTRSTTRSCTTRRRGATPLERPIAMPLQTVRAIAPNKVVQRGKPCCSVSKRKTTAARRSQSTKTWLSAFLSPLHRNPDHPKPRSVAKNHDPTAGPRTSTLVISKEETTIMTTGLTPRLHHNQALSDCI